MKPRYKVMVDDNFHYQDESERHEEGTYQTLEEALAVCRAIVDKSVSDERASHPGISGERLFERYCSFGDDPFIVVLDGVDEHAKFSAWDYAKELCGLKDDGHR